MHGVGRVLLRACVVAVVVGCTAGSPAPSGSSGIENRAMAGRLDATLDALQRIASESGGTRAAGTQGFDRSADWVAEQLARLGYDVRLQPVPFWAFDQPEPAWLGIAPGSRFAEPADLRTMIYSASGTVTAPVVSVGFDPTATAMNAPGCVASDWAAFPRGAIALLGPGACWRREQVLHAEEAGAVAVIVAYPWLNAGMLRQSTLVSPDGMLVPALAASGAAGRALLAAASRGAAVTVSVSAVVRAGEARNVLAAPRASQGSPFVLVGAHLDSGRDGPGINDNGSGVAAILALAEAAAAQPEAQPRLAFAFWGAEELGDIGSAHYVRTLDPAHRPFAYLNADMLGSPNGFAFVYDGAKGPRGSDVIQRLFVRELEAVGLTTEPIDLTSGSDGAPFAAAGIPIGGVFSGAADPKTAAQARTAGGTAGTPADSCYHLACDDRANVDDARLLALAGAFASVALELARAGSLSARPGGVGRRG